MIGSRSPILVATFSTTSGGAMPPTIRRTGSPGTTRSNVKMRSEVMKTISRPCAIRLTRNSRINIERSHLAFHRTGVSGRPEQSGLPAQSSGQRGLCHVLLSVRVDIEPVQLLAVGVDEHRGEQRQDRKSTRLNSSHLG